MNKISNLIEFLACTQIVEAHATPGHLKASRVPGMGKLARSIIRKAKETNKPLSDFFSAKNILSATEFYPMAAKGGTLNGKESVNELARMERKLVSKVGNRTITTTLTNNAHDYDMSADSE